MLLNQRRLSVCVCLRRQFAVALLTLMWFFLQQSNGADIGENRIGQSLVAIDARTLNSGHNDNPDAISRTRENTRLAATGWLENRYAKGTLIAQTPPNHWMLINKFWFIQCHRNHRWQWRKSPNFPKPKVLILMHNLNVSITPGATSIHTRCHTNTMLWIVYTTFDPIFALIKATNEPFKWTLFKHYVVYGFSNSMWAARDWSAIRMVREFEPGFQPRCALCSLTKV